MGGGIVINNLLFARTDRAIVVRRIDRQDLPHLTILFKTDSGEIDGHLKDELAPTDADPYTPLFTISKAKANQLEEEMPIRFREALQKVNSGVNRVKPEWLINKGYVIALIRKEPFQSAILRAIPKHRGKYRFETDDLKKLFTGIDPSMISLLHPKFLDSDKLKNWQDGVFAVRARGKKRMISLLYAPSTDGSHWLRVESDNSGLPTILESIIAPKIKQAFISTWHKIHQALQLHELGIARD